MNQFEKQNRFFVLREDEKRAKYAEHNEAISPFDLGIPLVELSDPIIEQIYYFRWHTYCKQIKKTPDGWVVTEFLPNVSWAGKYNTINCATGHHFYEGRWFHNQTFLDDYARFWFTEDARPRKYSCWMADAIYAMCNVRGDFSLAESLYDDLKNNYAAWESEKMTENGMFRQRDGYDGMEYSIGGNGIRPTINSYMYGDAMALSNLAKKLGKTEDAEFYGKKAMDLKEKINTLLWDSDATFYKTRKEPPDDCLVDVREELGYIPWYFNIPPADRSVAWRFLNDEHYFKAPFGPTSAEQNHPDFMKPFDHDCLWNGPSWPFATSQTLTAMGNLICNYKQNVISNADYFDLLKTYANSHFLTLENGEKIPYIDEDLDPYTGEWIVHKLMFGMNPPHKDAGRGKDYNHSTFCDLVLSGLAGIRADRENKLIIQPLFDGEQLDYFCADGILYHGHFLTVLWDKSGQKYGRGVGFHVLCDGKEMVQSDAVAKIEIEVN